MALGYGIMNSGNYFFGLIGRPEYQMFTDFYAFDWSNFLQNENISGLSCEFFRRSVQIAVAHQVLVRLPRGRKDGRRFMAQVPGSEEELPCRLLLIAAGFLGPEGLCLTGGV